MRGTPLGPVEFMSPARTTRYDRGHFIAHSLGGGLYINIFPQPAVLNRGWSEDGKLFRSMERYCKTHPGTYCFARALYAGQSAHPAVIEFGVLKVEGELWVNSFPNCGTAEEMAEIERLLGEKLADG